MAEIEAYLAHQFGFSELASKYIIQPVVKKIEDIGIKVLEPFTECAKLLNLEYYEKLDSYREKEAYMLNFSRIVGFTNEALIRKSNMMLAILDGGHSIDDGVAGELGSYHAYKQGPIIAIRSDFRLGENLGSLINPMLLYYIEDSNGFLATLPNAEDKWMAAIKSQYDKLKSR